MRPTGARNWGLRRTAFLLAALAGLCLTGLTLLLLRWAGDRGAPPVARLYLPGEWDTQSSVLLSLERQPFAAPARDCYRVLGRDGDEPATVCAGRPLRVHVGDALVDISIGARGVPRVSLAGQRLRTGDWLGSLADPDARPRPRFPLRAYGVPGLAARVVACSSEEATQEPAAESASICLEVHDRLGRLAVARPAFDETTAGEPGDLPSALDNPLHTGQVYRLFDGDEVWLGLTPFRLSAELPAQPGTEEDPDRRPTWTLARVDRARADPATRTGTGRGGDRRWLGRLWTQEAPDPAPAPQQRYSVHPLHQRYTPHNLSRQRVNFEGEDALQRLIDGGWLCLDASDTAAPRLAWRPLDAPGCAASEEALLEATSSGEPPSTPDDELRRLYYQTRHGSLAFLSAGLLAATEAALADGRYLRDPTVLPLAFDWHLQWQGDGEIPQPVPSALWGVRFGTTRQVHRQDAGTPSRLPDVLPRSTTSRHVLQLWQGDELVSTLALARSSEAGQNDAPITGSSLVCHGQPEGESWQRLRTPGHEYLLLGAVTLPSEAGNSAAGNSAAGKGIDGGWWSASAQAGCTGCALRFASTVDGLTLEATGTCPDLPGAAHETTGSTLGEDTEFSLPPWRLTVVDRGEPWLARTDPADGGRRFAREFSDAGGLEPLLGGETALAGVEAAVREWRYDGGGIAQRRRAQNDKQEREAFELTVDADLQLAAAAIVERHAREVVEASEGTPVTAVILDADDGAVLAAVNWSPESSGSGTRPRVSAWELGSGQVEATANLAFLRRGAAGSTLKVAGGYALINSGGLLGGATRAGAVPPPRFDLGVIETRDERAQRTGKGGQVWLQRPGEERPRRPPRCSTGPHLLPAGDAGFTSCTFVRRFAESCNSFFLLSALRHLDATPASLHELRAYDPASTGVDADALRLLRSGRDGVTLLLPGSALAERGRRTQPTTGEILAQRLQHGLAVDFASDSAATAGEAEPAPPRSLYGVLLAAGFQPQPRPFPPAGRAPAELRFGDDIAVSLEHRWFQPSALQGPLRERRRTSIPALLPGRDFAYPGVPSPGRLDPRTRRGSGAAAEEFYDGEPVQVRRSVDDGRLELQVAMMAIGQSSVQTSTLGLAALFAPAARLDGRGVAPCLFRAGCGEARAGRVVLGEDGADLLRAGLRRVLEAPRGTERGGTAYFPLQRTGLGDLAARGWGGKTGTYEVERASWPEALIARRDWQRLVARLCGVEGVPAPGPSARPAAWSGSRRALLSDLETLRQAAPGAGLGSRTCEDPDQPLHPAGIQGYQRYNQDASSAEPSPPARLDRAAGLLRQLLSDDRETLTYHAFVIAALPPGGEAVCSARGIEPAAVSSARGLVVAVLVDDETPKESGIAVRIGGELADAVERWATSRRTLQE